MSIQAINNGAYLNDPTAELTRDAFTKVNQNFQYLLPYLEHQGNKLYFLNLSGIDTSQGELAYVAAAINRGVNYDSQGENGFPFTKGIGQSFLFYTVTQSGNQTDYTKYYRFYRIHPNWKEVGGDQPVVSINQVDSSKISPAGSYTVNSADNPDLYIHLGELSDLGEPPVITPVEDAFNEGQPAPFEGEPWEILGIKFITATVDGLPKTWLFIGGDGLWGGDDQSDPEVNTADEDDFFDFSDQEDVDPPVEITTEQVRVLWDPVYWPRQKNLRTLDAHLLGLHEIIGKIINEWLGLEIDFDTEAYYADTAAMIADQESQTQDKSYFVEAEKKIYTYLGTDVGDITDYREEDASDRTGRSLYVAAANGAQTVNWNQYETFSYQLSGTTTLSDSNLPGIGKSKTIIIYVKGEETLNVPAGWNLTGDAYNGTVWNRIVLTYTSGPDLFDGELKNLS